MKIKNFKNQKEFEISSTVCSKIQIFLSNKTVELTRRQLPLPDDVTDRVNVFGGRVLKLVGFDVTFRVHLNSYSEEIKGFPILEINVFKTIVT